MERNILSGSVLWKFLRRHSSRGIWRYCVCFAIITLLLLSLATVTFYIPKNNGSNHRNSGIVNHQWRLADRVVSVAASNNNIIKAPVFLTVIENNSIPLVLNWLCHVQDFIIPRNIVIITRNNVQRDLIKNHLPEIKTFSIENDNTFFKEEESYLRTKLCELKIEIILKLMKRNMNVLVFRVDAVWVQNPMVPIEKIVNTDKGIDIVTTTFTGSPSTLDSGLFFVKSTAESITLVNELLSVLRNMLHRISHKKYYILDDTANCFNFLSQLVHRRFGHIRYRLLPLESFADRYWYEQKETRIPSDKTTKFRELFLIRIYTDNDDIRLSTKMSLMQNWNYWFLDEKQKCHYDKVVQMEKRVWGM